MTSNAVPTKHALETAVRGAVHVPGDPTWDDARKAWNLTVDQHPAAVVEVADTDDVLAAVRAARSLGMPVVAQSTGHAATEHGVTGAILLRMHALDSVEIDADRSVARVGGGTMWKAVLERLDGTGLLGLGGSAPHISVVGYTLGGGLSWFGRKYGLASSGVRSVELVTATGDLTTVTAKSDPDLFWALRGYGGEFGIVTSMEFDLYPSPGVVGVRLLFPSADSRPVLEAFATLTASAPPELSASVTLLHLPDLPFIPEARRGQSFVAVNAAYLGTLDECNALLAGVVAAGSPLENVIEPVAMADLGVIADDPVDPAPSFDLGTLLRRFDSSTIDDLLEVAGPDSGTPLLGINIRHLGGAISEAPADPAVAGPVAEPYQLFTIGGPGPNATPADMDAVHRGVPQALGEAATDRTLYNFLGRSEPERAYDAATLDRLRTLKKERDPEGAFRMTRPLPR